MPHVSRAMGTLLSRCDSTVLEVLRYGKKLAREEGGGLLCLRHVLAAAAATHRDATTSTLSRAGIDVKVIYQCLEELGLTATPHEDGETPPLALSGRVATLLTLATKSDTVRLDDLLAALCAGPTSPNLSPTHALLEQCRLR